MPPRKDFKQSREVVDVPKEQQHSDLRLAAGSDPTEFRDKATIRDHPMKKMQSKSHDGHGITLGLIKESSAALKLNRSNDLLAQSSTETLLDMLKAHDGIKDCSDETVLHINGVSEAQLFHYVHYIDLYSVPITDPY